jgi:ribose 5-phosphate isomerase B
MAEDIVMNRRQRRGIRRIAVGADHGGFELKAALVALLRSKGLEVADLGTHSAQPCDYPGIGCKVAASVASGRFDRGVLLCKSGIGIAIAANKVPGIRAAVCGDVFDAERSRAHNDANVLVLGAEKLSRPRAKRILEAWLATPFESGGRHERRVRQIAAIEREFLKRGRGAGGERRGTNQGRGYDHDVAADRS